MSGGAGAANSLSRQEQTGSGHKSAAGYGSAGATSTVSSDNPASRRKSSGAGEGSSDERSFSGKAPKAGAGSEQIAKTRGPENPHKRRKRRRGGKRSVFTRAEVGLPAGSAETPGDQRAAGGHPASHDGHVRNVNSGQVAGRAAGQIPGLGPQPDVSAAAFLPDQPKHVRPANRPGAGTGTGPQGRHSRTGDHRPSRYLRRHYEEDDLNQTLYAALDLGTNNCRLLIAKPEERGFRVVDAYSRIVRLGEGVGASRRLSENAMERSIDALANCHRKLAERGVQRSRLIATEACRAAENGAEFISRVQKETGLALEVVDRETEARLAVAGCVTLVDQHADGVILFDIGGGSSEIVWLDLRNRSGARGFALTRFIRSWDSLPVGVVNLAERHGGVNVTFDVFEAMVADVAGHLAGFNLGDELTEAIASGSVHMLGTSGTVTTLAGIHLGLRRYDRRRVDGVWLEDHQVGAMIDRLREMSYEERVENPCIGADRADLVLAGCAILEAIRRRWTCSRLRVADRGLREGILTELMAADGVWSKKTSDRRGGRQRGRT
ncbi:Ppx/GppA phosphatase family protein [Roseibium sp. H3510]|uniref:Ppx/GppA phosphatase family protein n=1 Tax=Roseibium algae TaxID=3123038 RepID=A0ABU8TQG3_9HYPH